MERSAESLQMLSTVFFVEPAQTEFLTEVSSMRSIISKELIAFKSMNETRLLTNFSSSIHITNPEWKTITFSSTLPALSNEKICSTAFEDLSQQMKQHDIFCKWTWDQFLCWPPTPAGAIARMRCPAVGHGIDTTKFAERSCLQNGSWSNKPNDLHYNLNGWTNYTPCFKPDVIDLMQQLYSGGNSEVVKTKFAVAERTRTLEIVGLMLSLGALLLSLIIFCNFRTLRNNRTKIHKSLFVAMIIQVIIRLTLYLDQAIIRGNRDSKESPHLNGIENTPYVCEASYVLLEYARTAMFMWMFIEGLYLHNLVTATVLQGRFPNKIYTLIGWGLPAIMTTVWATVTSHYKSNEPCWWNYNLTPYYWILEGPRLTVIVLNFFFLLNIIRVLVIKLRQSQTSDVEQVRKAVRAAAVLLPLLGITNVLHIIQAPINRTALEFALWSYITHFLTSFQGFFIAMIYCFLNGEVRAALFKSITIYISLRGQQNWATRRTSIFSGGCNTTVPATPSQANDSQRNSLPVLEPNDKIGRSHNRNNPSPERNHRKDQSWLISLCLRRPKVLIKPSGNEVPPDSVVFELSEQ